MTPLNRDDDARRLFTKKRPPGWLKIILGIVLVTWLYAISKFVLWMIN